MTGPPPISVYPVGVLANVLRAWRYLTARGFPTMGDRPPWSWRIGRARAELSHARRRIVRYVRNRQWHELRQCLNGYLAEPYDWPPGLTRCGRGWTRRRALLSLQCRARQPGVSWDRLQPHLDEALGRRR